MSSSLRDRLRQEVEGWRPEPNDEVFGQVVSISEREGDYDPYPYIEIDDEDSGKIIGVHAFHTVLKNEIAAKKPQVGDTLGIVYLGKQTSKRVNAQGKSSEFEAYRVVHESGSGEPPAAPDWEAHAQNGLAEAEEAGIPSDSRDFDTEEPF